MDLLSNANKHGFFLRLCFILGSILIVGQHSSIFVESKSIATTTSSSNSDNPSSVPTPLKNESNTIINVNTTVSPINTEDKSIIEVEGNSSLKTNATNANYLQEYKPLSFDSPEDTKTQQEWGGNCTLAHWDQCKVLEKYFGKYLDPKDEEIKEYLIDCREEPVVCLKNSWTVTRCNLLCMSKCNREIQFKYDKYVSHSGECKAHAHG